MGREEHRLVKRAHSLSEELRQIEAQISAINERVRLLVELSGAVKSPSPDGVEPPADASGQILRGPAIREVAIRVLSQRHDREAPIHYKDWLSLMHEEGYAVDGANEPAVFLSQITRSPLVARTTKAGTYQLDLDAPERLRRRLAQLQAQVRDGSVTTGENPADLAAHRTRRRELNREIGRTERQLEEALRMLGDLRLRLVEGAENARG